MIVSRRNGTVLNHWPRSVVLCLYYIMYIFKDSDGFKLSCVRTEDCIEFTVSQDGNRVDGVIGRGIQYNWIAFPSLNISCQLADFSDEYWNSEQLYDIFKGNTCYVRLTLLAINEMKNLFEQDYQDYSDGYKFMSKNEYIFWLQNQCEIISSQMLELEMRIEDELHLELREELEEERNEFHKQMRDEYDDAIFE